MNNLVESVRYGLKNLLNNEENLLNNDLLNNLLQVKYFVFFFDFNKLIKFRVYQNRIQFMQKIFN